MSGSSSMMRTLCNLIPSVILHWICRRLGAVGRNQNRKAAAAPRRAFQLNLAFVRFDDVLDQRQPQAAAFGVVDEAGADAIKLLEDFFLLRARNADALIGYFN